MQLNIEFEISALAVVLVVLCLQLMGRKTAIKRSKVFQWITLSEILVVLSNIITKCMLYYVGRDAFSQVRFIIDVYYVFQYLIPILVMVYMIYWTGQLVWSQSHTTFFFVLLVLAYVEEIIRNFVTHHIYEFHPVYGFVETDQINYLNGIAITCILYAMIYSACHIQLKSFGKLTLIALMGLITGVAMVCQIFTPQLTFIDFVVSIDLLVLYYIAQNPSEILDNNTDVLNRNMMDEFVQADINVRKPFDLIVLALDDFKFVNKTFGVQVGDMMLLQVGNFLQTMSSKVTVYRYSSDQFVVRIRHNDQLREEIIWKIQERFRHPWITEEVSVMMSTTIGCITFPDDGELLEELIDVIDYSIICAKKSGKGNVVYAKDIDLYALRKEKAIEKAVELAIEQDTIEVHYQPIYSTEKGGYTSAEALVRIKDDLLGNISPEVFIPVAERNGSIVKMGTMIFEKVCRFISQHNLKDTSIEYIEINVSVVQCMQQDFVETLNEIMERYGVTPDQINLEVTETAAANSLTILQENVEKLHEQGISFSLDDYGSGYANIGYIHQLPFKIIKLDKLMVWDSFENERAGITLKHTVGMLKELNLHIVAEGVETQEQQKKLSSIGCDYLQGWYYSKAVPEEVFARMIKEVS